MRPVSISTSGVSNSATVVLDQFSEAPVVQAVVTGVVNYTIQATNDDPFAAISNWFSCDVAALVAATTSQIGVLGYIPRAIRMTQASGAGSVAAIVSQAHKFAS